MNSKEIVESLGGPAAVGRMLGVTTQAVTYWVTREPTEIPYRQRVMLMRNDDCTLSVEEMFPEIFE